MADLVFCAGTSHSPALNSRAEDYPKHAEIDRGAGHWKRQLLDRNGAPRTYEELLAKAPANMAALITPDAIQRRIDQCQADIHKLGAAIEAARLDALVIIGDDQREQFDDSNMPAIMLYWGDTIQNGVLRISDDAPDWWRRARSQFHEADAPKDYPVASDLALHMIGHLMDREFDIAQATSLKNDRGEGHAFGFFHKRLMGSNPLAIVPVALNTYYPPNQPRPKRCYQLGREIARAIETFDRDCRVGVLASGGLSHFTIDEELDTLVLDACRAGDADALTSIPVNQLNSGNSEIRNWIAAAGAAQGLTMTWSDYAPCYRSAAGTGCGMAFATWG